MRAGKGTKAGGNTNKAALSLEPSSRRFRSRGARKGGGGDAAPDDKNPAGQPG